MNHRLLDILTIRREHESKGEKYFISKYMKGFEPVKSKAGEVLAYKHVIEKKGDKNSILWSSHIDTMHRTRPEVTKQNVYVDDFGTAFVDEASDCLGADTGAGVWLLLEMIANDVAGTYVFHRGEEKGCIGSSGIAEDYPDFLKSFTHAIAFDRRDNVSVISHQSGGRCASDDFCNAFINLLNMNHKIDPNGIYTDTAEYTHLIGECSNISIGYKDEHNSKETLDITYLEALRDRMVSIEWHKIKLPTKRKPESKTPRYNYDYDFFTYEDLMYLDHKQLVKWIKGSDPRDIAYALEDLIAQIGYMQDSYSPYEASHDPEAIPF